MAPKVDSLNIVSNTKPLSVVSKPENNSNIKVFSNNEAKANVDEVELSSQNNNRIEEKSDNKKKWLIGAGIVFGTVAIGIAGYLLFKKIKVPKHKELSKSEYVELVSKQPYINKIKNNDIRTYEQLFIGNARGRSSNEGVNTLLRTGEIPWHQHTKENLEEIIDSAHFAMQKSKLTKDTVLYRYVKDMDYLPKEGGIFTEKGFLSTGFDESYIRMYGDKLITIKVPKGTPCLVEGRIGGYGEVLLMDGLSFRVARKHDFGADLICEKARDLSKEELRRAIDYGKKVELESQEWVKDLIEEKYWNWK